MSQALQLQQMPDIPIASALQTPTQAFEYAIDAWQRSVLFLDVMRQRAEQYHDHTSQTVPHVLDYEVELVLDGRTLARPVNYCLGNIVPPKSATIDPARRPFVVVDPRAGHGPGIGGFKADSEVGVALKSHQRLDSQDCYAVRQERQPVSNDNPFVHMQQQMSDQIVEGLETWRKAVEKTTEETFRTVFGQPWLQAMLGIDTNSHRPPRKAAKDLLHAQLIATRKAELTSKIPQGGLREALARALLYVAVSGGTVDERGFEAVQRLRRSIPTSEQTSLAEFKTLIREQFFMLLIDEEAALAAIPTMLPEAVEERRHAFETLRDVARTRGSLSEESQQRLDRLSALFRLGGQPKAVAGRSDTPRRKAS